MEAYKITKEDELAMDEAMSEMIAFENEVFESNKSLLIRLNIPIEEMESLLDGCSNCYHEKMDIVESPKGDNQCEDNDFFESIYVDQWSVGMEGDSFQGNIYAKFDEGKWLRVPYFC